MIWFNALKIHGRVLLHKPVTTDDFIYVLHNYWGSGRPASVYWYVSPVRIIVPSSRMASSPLTIILLLISEQYMIELHSPPGRDTIFRYLADYVNTPSPIWYILDNNTNPSGFLHIYTRKVLLPHIKHLIIKIIRHIPRCVIRLLLHLGLYYMRIR